MSVKKGSAQDKWNRIKRGERVVVSDEEMGEIEAIDDPMINRLASLPNPNQVGTRDTYVAFIKGSKMVTRKATKKTPARRKAAEDDEEVKDLDDLENPEELKAEGDDEEVAKDEAPFEPLGSAMEAAKAHGNLKAIKDYFGEGGEGDLKKMDHPGMRDGLKALLDDDGPIDKAMQHLKDLIGEHHADLGDPSEAMEKMCKSLEEGDAPVDKGVEQLEDDAPTTELKDDELTPVEEKDDSFATGEDNLVASGAIPEGDLDPEKSIGEQLVVEDGKEIGEEPGTFWLVNRRGTAVDGPFRSRQEAEQKKPAMQKDEAAGDDTEEILERYQNPKTGKRETRKAGVAWRAKNGRVYVKLAPAVVRKVAKKDFGEDEEGKDLTDTGNPAELKGEVTDEHLDAIGKAADHLDDAAADPATPKMHKSAHSFHSKALRKALDDLGNPQELKDDVSGTTNPGEDLTEGVEELKDVDEEENKGTGTYHCRNCQFSTEDLAAADQHEAQNPGHSIAKALKTSRTKTLSPTVAKVLEELRSTRQELNRKARMHGLLNGN